MRPVHALLAALLLTGACERAPEGTRSRPASEALTPDRLEHDFGRVPIDSGAVTALFRVVNESSDAVRLLAVSTSCGCTTATAEFTDGSTVGSFDSAADAGESGAGRLVVAGEAFQVRVEFDPAAHGPGGTGHLMREVVLATADGGQTRLVITADVFRG